MNAINFIIVNSNAITLLLKRHVFNVQFAFRFDVSNNILNSKSRCNIRLCIHSIYTTNDDKPVTIIIISFLINCACNLIIKFQLPQLTL